MRFWPGLRRISGFARRILPRLARRSRHSERELALANQRYWQNQSNKLFPSFSHWRGFGPFTNDEVWLNLGQSHLNILQGSTAWNTMPRPLDRIVEWGCGGGANAVHFAPLTREYYGVDISAASLTECGRQVSTVPGDSFIPVKINALVPDSVIESVSGPIDLFLSTYVFELLPSPDYGLRVMRVAYRLLRPGGMGLVQIRYHTGDATELSKLRDYDTNVAHMTTYAIHEFWVACEQIGFIPLFTKLLPDQPELQDGRYAYFVLIRPR